MIPSIRLSIRPPKSTEPSEPELLSVSKSAGSSAFSARDSSTIGDSSVDGP
jgi:hypothetical protein